jgi:hypothetical protein
MREQRNNPIRVDRLDERRAYAVAAGVLEPGSGGPSLHVHSSLNAGYHGVEGSDLPDRRRRADGSSRRVGLRSAVGATTHANRSDEVTRLLILWTRGRVNGHLDESRTVGPPLGS